MMWLLQWSLGSHQEGQAGSYARGRARHWEGPKGRDHRHREVIDIKGLVA